ncbi:DUF1080 domain-containing protein [Gimesia fumaroli]|uniref:Trehalose utilization n=1 Tax=Gimesia fumaroli TaxID=2527976 RepID=A0A518I5F5_9PLAN|nr:family 16 glycoside hydrolase [Gimesia fumaroli]QDV48334.1 Trehalose utilization [Gimesia fumaroli]
MTSRRLIYIHTPIFLCLFCLAFFLSPPVSEAGEDGFKPIFDGKTLKNWDGDPRFWSVKDGAITGRTTKENPTKGNTFIIWRGGTPGDFELKLKYKIINGNSGIQYRSFSVPGADKWRVGGYQGDFEAGDTYSGILYGERFRGILGLRGQKTVIGKDHKPKVVGSVGDTNEIQQKIKKEDWNDYHIIARGNHFIHKINGVTTVDVTDEDVEQRREDGIIALQLHQGPPMVVQFRDIELKEFPKANKTSSTDGAKKKVVLIAGKKSHGYGAHEHRAGCILLADALNKSGLNMEATVVTEGWPKDSSILQDADSIVIYCDGGGRHPYNAHLDELNKLAENGVGMVNIHYGVEVPKGESGDAFLRWIGGYFEEWWSVNPHWTADYQSLPAHPISNGVEPFAINDEWYYHMRFQPEMKNVQPILTAIPPKETLKRPDGPHSGNPAVRKEIGQPQHMAWAYQRPDGGRGFGFTGGHFHWNWGHDDFRKLVLNAIAWTAHVEVPSQGIDSAPVTVELLEENQDYSKPDNFNPARIKAMLAEWNQ